MGIQDLSPKLKKVSTQRHISSWSGYRAAVDAGTLIFKYAATTAATAVPQAIFEKLNGILDAGVEPIIVFDGADIGAKAEEKAKRARNRKKNNGIITGIPGIVEELKGACKIHGIAYIQAPFEADPQIKYLMDNDLVKIVVSEDSDFVVHDCKQIFYKMDKDLNGDLYNHADFEKCFGAPFWKDSFAAICILVGSDYFPGGLRGFGVESIKNYYPKMGPKFSYEKMVKLLGVKFAHLLDDEFKERYFRAFNTFKYQLVVDPISNEIKPVTPYENGKKPEDFPYVGKLEEANAECFFSKDFQWDSISVNIAQQWHRCTKCVLKFTSEQDLDVHFENVHGVTCLLCEKTFKSHSLLVIHIEQRHSDKRAYPCDLCDKSFKTSSTLWSHKHRVHVNLNLACPNCGRRFKHLSSLKEHEKNAHTNKRSFQFQCDQCSSAFTTKLHLAQHVTAVHLKQKNFECSVCQKGFAMKCNMVQHMRTHDDDPTRPFKCSLCNKGFKAIEYLKAHLKNVCNQDVPKDKVVVKRKPKSTSQPDAETLSCEFFCGAEFASVLDRNQHYEEIHPGANRMQCIICSQVCGRRRDVEVHMKTHKVETLPFRCTKCLNGFKSKDSLRRHIRVINCDNSSQLTPSPNQEDEEECLQLDISEEELGSPTKKRKVTEVSGGDDSFSEEIEQQTPITRFDSPESFSSFQSDVSLPLVSTEIKAASNSDLDHFWNCAGKMLSVHGQHLKTLTLDFDSQRHTETQIYKMVRQALVQTPNLSTLGIKYHGSDNFTGRLFTVTVSLPSLKQLTELNMKHAMLPPLMNYDLIAEAKLRPWIPVGFTWAGESCRARGQGIGVYLDVWWQRKARK